MAINSAAALQHEIEMQRDQLDELTRTLRGVADKWGAADVRAVPARMGEAAIQAGVPEADVAEYVGGMESWLKSAHESLVQMQEAMDVAYKSFGALDHCAFALRRKANQARAARRDDWGSVV